MSLARATTGEDFRDTSGTLWCRVDVERRVGQLLPPQVGLSDRFVRATRHVLLQCDCTVADFLVGNRLVARISRPSTDFFHRQHENI